MLTSGNEPMCTLTVPSKLRAQEAANQPVHHVSSNSASVQRPSPLPTCLHTPVPCSSLPCGWRQTWNLLGYTPYSRRRRLNQSILCFLTFLTILYIPAVLNVISQQTSLWNRDPSPVRCCLLVLKLSLQSTHCSLLSVSLHDTLTSYCSCMNKSVFPTERQSRLALGASLVQQQPMYVANTAKPWPSVPREPTTK